MVMLHCPSGACSFVRASAFVLRPLWQICKMVTCACDMYVSCLVYSVYAYG